MTPGELKKVLDYWSDEGTSIDSLVGALNVGGTKRKALKRAFDGLEPDNMVSLVQAWMFMVDQKRLQSPHSRLCVTGINPEGFRHSVVDTLQAFQEVVAHAKRRLVIIGYRFNDSDENLMSALEDKMINHGLEVLLITDHLMGRFENDDQKRMLGWLMDGRANFRLWSYEAKGKMELMHVKCMMADRTIAYIGSANFSYGGAQRNVELGLLVRDKLILGAMEDFYTFLTSGEVQDIELLDLARLRKEGLV